MVCARPTFRWRSSARERLSSEERQNGRERVERHARRRPRVLHRRRGQPRWSFRNVTWRAWQRDRSSLRESRHPATAPGVSGCGSRWRWAARVAARRRRGARSSPLGLHFGFGSPRRVDAPPEPAIPRTPDGKPDFSGIWESVSGADYDLEPHSGRHDAPPGAGVVEGS